jgi:hypothetical protein
MLDLGRSGAGDRGSRQPGCGSRPCISACSATHLANDIGSDWDNGWYTRLHQQLLAVFIRAYPSPAR